VQQNAVKSLHERGNALEQDKSPARRQLAYFFARRDRKSEAGSVIGRKIWTAIGDRSYYAPAP